MPAAKGYAMMEIRQRENKKASKPLMEKRRRARINHCLSQLKSLVVDKTQNENTRQAKLEKADILELTVRHLYEIKKRQRADSLVNNPQTMQKFELGFVECLKEVESFLSNTIQTGTQMELQRRLKCHLTNRIETIRNGSDPLLLLEEEMQIPETSTPAPSPELTSTDEISLIPKRMPNGDLALIIPPHLLASGSTITCPSSAFRVICNQESPTYATGRKIKHEVDNLDYHRFKRRLCSWSPSPPPSGSESDLLAEEPQNRQNNVSFNNEQSVWRPW